MSTLGESLPRAAPRARRALAERVWLCLSAMALALQISGFHVHLCLDGFGPRESIHWDATDLREDLNHQVRNHHELDICLRSTLLIRSACLCLPAPLLTTRIVPLPVPPPELAAVERDSSGSVPLFATPLRLRPPPQAPPR